MSDSRRLNQELRQHIMSKLMATLPTQDATKWTKRMADLAERARMYGVSAGDRRRLDNMETCWTTTSEAQQVNISGELRINLDFSGSVYNLLGYRAKQNYKHPDRVYRMVRTEHERGYRSGHACIVIPKDDPIGAEVIALLDEIKAAQEEYNKKHAAAWAALENTNTVKQLVERWPEIAPFVPPPPPPEALPVIQRDDLNSAFNLPLSKTNAAKVKNAIVVGSKV